MKRYKRYVVVGAKRLSEHSYSTEIGRESVNFAISCADHPSMKGRVFGESFDGSRELVYNSQPAVAKD
jgi:hypothetical protein